MCKVRRNNVKVMKEHRNEYTGVGVELTRMTAKSGTIVYAVLVRRLGGKKYRIWKYVQLGKAFDRYKEAIA